MKEFKYRLPKPMPLKEVHALMVQEMPGYKIFSVNSNYPHVAELYVRGGHVGFNDRYNPAFFEETFLPEREHWDIFETRKYKDE